jgi:hypothetical protein
MPQVLVELLERFSRRISTEAAYLASMVLRYRLTIDDVSASKVINKGIIAQPKEEVRRAAISLLQEIEKSAGKEIASFDKKTTEKYLKDLAKIVQERAMNDLGYEEKRGQQVLKLLRNGAQVLAK